MKVSVAMLAYNHERFIAQAIDSVLMQKVNFDYEIIIGEDCSVDRTRDIVVDYQKRYPDRVRLLLPEKNLGACENSLQVHKACQGEYVAILEGDDYWTSPSKLQKQVDFLNSHPECALCFHNAIIFYEDGSGEPRSYCRADQKEISTLEDLLAGNFIPTCSVMFRRGLFDEIPDWIYSVPFGDWPFHILNARYGKIGYIKEVMGAYRVHSGGVYSGQSQIKNLRGTIKTYGKINAYLNFEYEDIIRSRISERWNGWAEVFAQHLAEHGSVEATISKAVEVLDDWPGELPLSKAERARMLGRIYADLGFASYKAHDLPKTRHCFVRAIRYDPSWLRNRGVWSIGVNAFLGERLTGWLGGGAKSVCRR
jgi:glycosyltransferase involved in cell wall biosynthesis